MPRFYKLLALLYVLLFALSFLYCTVVSWTGYQITISHHVFWNKENRASMSPSGFIQYGLLYGFITSLVIFIILVLLISKAVRKSIKFTVKRIMLITGGFFLLTTIIVVIYLIWDVNQDYEAQFRQILRGERDKYARFPYFIFLVAWFLYYFLVSLTVKRKTDG